MKNYLIILLVACGMASCTQDEVNQEAPDNAINTVDPLSDMRVDLLAAETKNAGSSADNPIVISSDTFVDLVDYTVDVCRFGSGQLERFGGLFYGLPVGTTSSAPSRYRLTADGCYERIRTRTTNEGRTEFFFGTYYEIFGQVVRKAQLGRVGNFWFTEIPNSNQVRRVDFFENGTFNIGEPIPFPFETGLDCSGAGEFPTGEFFATDFERGDRLVQNVNGTNLLYVSDGLFLRFQGICAEGEIELDICAGIDAFQSFRFYLPGDQVTYRGFLFTRLEQGWRREGACFSN